MAGVHLAVRVTVREDGTLAPTVGAVHVGVGAVAQDGVGRLRLARALVHASRRHPQYAVQNQRVKGNMHVTACPADGDEQLPFVAPRRSRTGGTFGVPRKKGGVGAGGYTIRTIDIWHVLW